MKNQPVIFQSKVLLWACRYKAATPATKGAAAEVPDCVTIALLDLFEAEVIFSPGAKMSTHEP